MAIHGGAHRPRGTGKRERSRVVVAAVGLGLLAGCNGGGDAREWTPADHDNSKKAGPGQTSGIVAPGDEDSTLIEVTWRQNCARCHGLGGRGDGPDGRMVRVPDLTRPEVAKLDDEMLKLAIRKGRNKMPAFPTLPPKVVDGLVKRIRGF